MPGDVQLTALATKAAPLNYRVPGAAMIRVKSVRAEFTDNTAGGDWLPAVQLISDSGHVIATASDQGAKVTIGGSADASFFPGVKHAAAAAVTKLSPIYGILSLSGNNFADPPFAVAAGAALDVQFPHQDASNSGAFTFQPSTTYSDTIRLSSTDYLYVVHASVRWNATGFNQQTQINGPSPTLVSTSLFGALDNHGQTPANNFLTGGVFPGDNDWAVDTKAFVCQTVPADVTLHVLHGSAGTQNVGEANLLVLAFKVF